MDKYDYHFISLKFLSAIIMALFFAFLLTYVFSPMEKSDYPVYNFESQKIEALKEENFLDFADAKAEISLAAVKKEEFKSKLRQRSFAIMEATKNSTAAVITSNHLEKVNGLRKEEELILNDYRLELKSKEEKLLQQKRQELENELSTKLQVLRQKTREKYSDYSDQEIRKNYLRIINLQIGLEVLAENEAEKKEYRNKLEKVKKEQEELLAKKDSVLNDEISAETSTLIMEFNQNYTEYRRQLRNEHQNLLNQKEEEIDYRLAEYREKISEDLNSAKKEKRTAMEQLITKSKEYY